MKSVVTTLGTEPSWVSSGGNRRGDTVPAYDRKNRQKQMYIYSISKRYNDKTKMQPCLVIVLNPEPIVANWTTNKQTRTITKHVHLFQLSISL